MHKMVAASGHTTDRLACPLPAAGMPGCMLKDRYPDQVCRCLACHRNSDKTTCEQVSAVWKPTVARSHCAEQGEAGASWLCKHRRCNVACCKE